MLFSLHYGIKMLVRGCDKRDEGSPSGRLDKEAREPGKQDDSGPKRRRTERNGKDRKYKMV